MKKMRFDYSKLKGKIKEIYDTQERFARDIKLSTTSTGYKLNNQTQFKQEEIYTIKNKLGIEDSELSVYFFTPLVEKTQQRKKVL